ncbi:MAG: flavin reductase family protein [Elusimicrobia bacterium]|nr:flavin reductase family protein [Elusimicrobiota bacterium]
MNYKEIPLDVAYRLINHGPVVLVSSRLRNGVYDIAPVAWNCIISKDPTSLVVAISKANATHDAIIFREEFAISIPCAAQEKIVKDTGAVSGADTEKFSNFDIKFIPGKKTDLKIPTGCTGYIECRLEAVYDMGGHSLLYGEAIYAAADPEGFSERVLPENEKGKTLHHLGSNVFAVPSLSQPES